MTIIAPVDPEPPHRCHTPPQVWIGLAIAVGLDAPVQLIWKALMMKYADPARGPHGWAAFGTVNHVRWFLGQTRTYALLALFACQFLDWIFVLGNADLSFAQPFTALSYVVVSGCAVAFFGEHLTPLRACGIGLILGGVVLVGSGGATTTTADKGSA